MTKEEMLQALTKSENRDVAFKARALLDGTLKEAFYIPGGFMKCVMEGNYEAALQHADSYNRKALLDYRKQDNWDAGLTGND